MKMTAQIQVYLWNQRKKKLKMNLLDEEVPIFIKLPKGKDFLLL